MRKIKGFESFNESVMLQMINETALYFLPDMRLALAKLSNSGNDIAYRLLLKVGVDTMKDITLVELEDDKLSFMSKAAIDSHDPEFMQKLDRGYELSKKSGDTIKNFKNRNQIKIGKFVTSVLGEVPAKELEDFVNKLKSSKDRGLEIKIVEGEEIKKYYRTEALTDNPNQTYSEIMKSCMRDKEKVKPNVFDIYTKNPESCKMVVMLDENGGLVSRAILWKVNNFQNNHTNEYYGGTNVEVVSKLNLPESFWFMDRVYSVENWMDKSMHDWATKNGYAFKNRDWGQRSVQFNGAHSSHCEMQVDVKKIAYKGFPYMDTFIYYDVKNGKLRNFDSDDFKGFNLQSTEGNYGMTTGYEPVFRNYIRRFTK
jgi:hypothetical protein